MGPSNRPAECSARPLWRASAPGGLDLPRHDGRRTCVLGGHEVIDRLSVEVNFTESLILAQDERWRRA